LAALLAFVTLSAATTCAQDLPSTQQFNGALTTCATNSDIAISADLLGSVSSVYDGQKTQGTANLKTASKFIELFPEGDRLKIYELYTKCISQILGKLGSRTDAPTIPLGSMVVTERLGLQFIQDEHVVPIREGDKIDQVFHSQVVDLERKPFEILLPADYTSEINAGKMGLMINASDSASIYKLPSDALFHDGAAMADYEHGSGGLLASDLLGGEFLTFNYIDGGRFSISRDGKRGLFVSSVIRDDQNLILGAGRLYLMCRYERYPPSKAHRRDTEPTEYITIEFAH
jgi:hypothetical protein